MTSMVWWLSFVDPDRPEGQRFLGVSIVHADDQIHAVQRAWDLGCNPGGEILIAGVDEHALGQYVPPKWCGRLLTKEECALFDAEMAERNPFSADFQDTK